MIRAVTFDCWGTLIAEAADVELAPPAKVRLEAIVEVSGGRLGPREARALLDRAWEEHRRRWLAGIQYGSRAMAKFCAQQLGLDGPGAARLQNAFEEAARHGRVRALPGARTTLALLRRSGVRTALVCDTGYTPGRVVRELLEAEGLFGGLEVCAFSDEVGWPKPRAAIFLAALDGLGVSPQEAVHVGDLLRTDVWGARALGMKTVRIKAAGDDAVERFSLAATESVEVDADEVVGSHAELLGALRRLGVPLG